MLFALQLAHTIIAIVNFACLFYITWAHWTRRQSRFLRFCYWAMAIEAVAIVPFGLSCPIALLVHRVWGRGTPDILMPNWFSRWLIEAGIWLFAFAMIPPTVRWFRRRGLQRARSKAGERVPPPGQVGLPVAAADET